MDFVSFTEFMWHYFVSFHFNVWEKERNNFRANISFTKETVNKINAKVYYFMFTYKDIIYLHIDIVIYFPSETVKSYQ